MTESQVLLDYMLMLANKMNTAARHDCRDSYDYNSNLLNYTRGIAKDMGYETELSWDESGLITEVCCGDVKGQAVVQ